MLHSRRRCPGYLLGLLALLLAGEALALDFGSLPRAFRETFGSETASPTTPEVDLLQTEGLLVDGSLNGSTALLDIEPGIKGISIAAYAVGQDQGIRTYQTHHGFRADFSGLTLGSDGTVGLAIVGGFDALGAPVEVQLAVELTVTQDAGGNSAELRLAETETGGLPNENSFALPEGAVDLILAGASVRIDAYVDDDGLTLIAEVEVDDMMVAGNALSLDVYAEHTLTFGAFVLVERGPIPPVTAEVHLELAETFTQPRAFTPLFNIDFAGANGKPTSGFAAAGGAGFWNEVTGPAPTALTDVDGNASSATVAVATSLFDNFGAGSTPDLTALLGDAARDCSDPDLWSLDFAGLTDGVYRVLVYAPSSSVTHTGDVSVNGVLEIGSLTGVSPPALSEGVSWAEADTPVVGNVLSIDGVGDGAVDCAGIAGVQLEIGLPVAIPPSVPSLGRTALLGATSLLLLAGCCALRRAS